MERLLTRYTNSYASYVILFFFYDLAFAFFSALISVYLLGKGFTEAQVSLVISAAALANMATQPIIGTLTDKFGMRKVNMVMIALTCVAAALFIIAPTFAMILAAYAFINLLMNGLNPTIERMATSSPYSYGSIRTWGTVGFAVGTQVTGIIYDRISPIAPYIGVILAMIIALLGFLGTQPRLAESEAANIEAEAEDAAPVKTTDLLKNKKFLYYLVLQILFAGATGAAYTFTPAALTKHLGMEASTASTVLALAVVLEIPLLIFSSKFMDKIGNKPLLITAFSIACIQMAAFAFVLPLPVALGLTFLTKHPGAILNIMTNMKVVNTIVDPRQQITGLALVKTCQSFGTIIANNVGGNIINAAGYPMMFLFLLGMLALGLVGVVFFKVPSGNDKKLFSK